MPQSSRVMVTRRAWASHFASSDGTWSLAIAKRFCDRVVHPGIKIAARRIPNAVRCLAGQGTRSKIHALLPFGKHGPRWLHYKSPPTFSVKPGLFGNPPPGSRLMGRHLDRPERKIYRERFDVFQRLTVR